MPLFGRHLDRPAGLCHLPCRDARLCQCGVELSRLGGRMPGFASVEWSSLGLEVETLAVPSKTEHRKKAWREVCWLPSPARNPGWQSKQATAPLETAGTTKVACQNARTRTHAEETAMQADADSWTCTQREDTTMQVDTNSWTRTRLHIARR